MLVALYNFRSSCTSSQHPHPLQWSHWPRLVVLLVVAAVVATAAVVVVVAAAAAVAAVGQLAVVTAPHTPCASGRWSMQPS
jgi:hypothetical protein